MAGFIDVLCFQSGEPNENNILWRSPISNTPHSRIYLYIQKGKFPAQIKLGSRNVAWNSEDIDAWIREKVDQSKFVN